MDKEKHEEDKQQWLKDQGKIIQHGIKKALAEQQKQHEKEIKQFKDRFYQIKKEWDEMYNIAKQHKEECKECFMIPVRELVNDNKILRKQLEQAEELLNIHGITI